MKNGILAVLTAGSLLTGAGGAFAADTLNQGERLYSNDYLESANGDYRFYLQGDGNLVLRDWNTRDSLWSSGTHGEGGVRLSMQHDGNLVLRDSASTPVWSSKTHDTSASTLTLSNNGRLALHDNGDIIWAVNDNGTGGNAVFEKRISSGSDDVEELANGDMYMNSSDIELVYDQGGDQLVGLRFTNVEVPHDADIESAYIQFTTDETGSSPTELTIRAEDTGSASRFDSADFDLSVRRQTSASAYWRPSSWDSVGQASAAQRTPDLSSVVQEVVNRSDWNSGNNLAFLISGYGERTAESYEGSSSRAAKLVIEYAGGSDNVSEPSDEIRHMGSTADYDSGGDVRLSVTSDTREGDLLMLFLSRTDDLLPIRLDGWTAGASCFKTTNGQNECHVISDCTSRDGDYCRRFDGDKRGRDLATVVFYRTVGSNDSRTYSIDMRGSNPGWGILTTLRGATNNDPIRDVATESDDGNSDSLFPSVYGRDGDMLLLSMAFDDTTDRDDFRAPSGMEMFKWIAGSDEAGYVYGERLRSNGETGSRKTHGPGGPNAKDALISITVR